jgi:oligopeptide transport system substrate-binding protein
LTEVTFKQITDIQASLAAYKNGELDVTGVPAGTEKATMADTTYGPQVFRFADLTTYAFQFNITKDPNTSKLLRQALATAVDRDAYITNIRGGVGHATTSWIPPGMPGYDATIGAAYKFDAAKAKSLLTQAGYTP